jgi:hypothetical protein
LLDEESKYPKGTVKLEEAERVSILNRLKEIKENLLEELCKFPVSSHVRSIKIRNKKMEVEHKLEEVDYALRIFELRRVFLKK